jgi:hypothetical protein
VTVELISCGLGGTILISIILYQGWVIKQMTSAVSAVKVASDAIKDQRVAEIAPLEKTIDLKDSTIAVKEATIENLKERLQTTAAQSADLKEKIREKEVELATVPLKVRRAIEAYDQAMKGVQNERSEAMYGMGFSAGLMGLGGAIRRIHTIVRNSSRQQAGSGELYSFKLSTFFFTNTLAFVAREMFICAKRTSEMLDRLGVPGDEPEVKPLRELFSSVIQEYEEKAGKLGSGIGLWPEVAKLSAGDSELKI